MLEHAHVHSLAQLSCSVCVCVWWVLGAWGWTLQDIGVSSSLSLEGKGAGAREALNFQGHLQVACQGMLSCAQPPGPWTCFMIPRWSLNLPGMLHPTHEPWPWPRVPFCRPLVRFLPAKLGDAESDLGSGMGCEDVAGQGCPVTQTQPGWVRVSL